MPKQTGSIDLSSQKQAHDDASKTATNYIRADSTGIRIANSNPDNATTYQHQTANDTEFIVGGVSRALISGNGARFGKEYVSGAQDNESHMELDYHSLQMIDKEGDPYLYISDLRDRSGTVNIVDTFYGDGSLTSFNLNYRATNTSYTVSVSDDSGGTVTKSSTNILFADAPTDGAIITVTYATASQQVKAFTFGNRNSNGFIGGYSFSAGYSNISSGYVSHAEGFSTKASGYVSHAEGFSTKASGYVSHAEGQGTQANGMYSHAEGQGTQANGTYSHAEGYGTTASGYQSHAEGYNTNATKWGAHAEGYSTTASGSGSHAQNYGTIASSDNQTAIGRWNIQDDSNSFAFIIGNGSNANNRSNALTVDWNGSVNLPSHVLASDNSGYRIFGTNLKTSGETNDTSANLWGTALEIRDHGNNQRSYIKHFETTGNHQGIQLETRRYINNAWVYNGLRLSVDGSGNRSVYVHDSNAWQVALGLSPVSGTVTASSGVTISNVSLYKVGKIVVLSVMTQRAQGTGGEAAVFTLPTGFRPSVAWRGPVGHAGKGNTTASGNASVYAVINTNGVVDVNSPAAINLVAATFITA